MNFGEVLSRAWEIIWKNKILWLFGILSGLGSSGGSAPNLNANYQFDGGQVPPQFQGIERFFENLSPLAIAAIVLAVILLTLLLVAISTFGTGGLLRGAWLADEGRTGFSFGRLWGEGSRYFWRLILLGLLIFAGTLALTLIIIIPSAILAALTMGIGLLCLLPLWCLLIPAGMLLGVVIQLAMISIVGEDHGVIEGLKRGWDVFRTHLGEVIGMAVILFIIQLVAGFIIGLPVLLTVAPAIVSGVMNDGQFFGPGLTVSLILFLIYLPFLLALGGMLTSYIQSAWVTTFRRLTGRSAGTGLVSSDDFGPVRVYDTPA